MKAKRISAIVLALVMALSTLNFSVFAEEITESSVAKIGDVEYVDLHKAMVACNAGETVVLISDVELAGTTWEPVSFKGTFDGQNYTVSNLTINKPGVSNTGFITSLNGTFKNVTFTNPTVTGGECTGVLAGRAGGSAALAENITVNGTIKVETTHSGYARAGVIVGGWAYGNYKKITVDGGDKAVSYIKHTGGGDGRYVAGIVGHADDVESYVNCAVKNITISGGWLCGGIAGPGPSDGLAEGCSVENIDMGADYSGGMFGWYYGSGTIKNSSVKNVAFTDGTSNNGAIGGYSANTDATVTNVTIENVTNGDKTLLDHVAELNGTYYFTLAEAVAEATSGDTITLLADTTISENVTLPAGIIFNGNGKKISRENSAIVYAGGDLTFEGYTTIANFNAYGNTITIGEGATLETTDGRMVIGHGATFNITGSITDAKSADTANITPSFIAPGASLTGAGVTFNVTNAYVKFTDYCSSKNNNASGTYSINVTNSIWEQAGSLVFSEPTNGMDPTFNFNIKDSVLNSTSHLVFAVTKGEIVFDNSLVNQGVHRQLENRSNLTIKNGSVVYAAHATSSNAKNPGTTIVENATYTATGEFSGSDVGTGSLVLKNNANVTLGTISKTNVTIDGTSLLTASKIADTTTTTITVDATSMGVGETNKVVDLNGNSGIEGIVTVIGGGTVAYGADGDVTVTKPASPVAEVNGTEYTDIQEAIKAAAPSGTVNLLSDVTVDKWIMFSQTKTIGNGNIITLEMDGLTINGNGHSLTVNSVESAKNGDYLFDDAAELNINNLTINMPEGADMGGIHSESGVIDNVTFNNGNCIFPGDGDITVNDCTFNTAGYVIYYEVAKDNLKVTGNTFNVDPESNVILLRGNETFTGNTINSGRTVNVVSGSPTVSGNVFADDVRLKVYNNATATITGNTLNYITFDDETSVNSTFEDNILSEDAEAALKAAGVIKEAVAEVGGTKYFSLQKAIDAAESGETITLLAECSNVDLTVNNAVTIDLGGKTITDAYIIIKKAVEIKNGDIVNTNEPYPLVVKGGHLTVNDVDIAASKSDRAIWLDSGTLDFNSGSILATKGEGNNKSSIAAIWVSSGQVNINGGTLTVDTPGADAIGVYGNYANAHVTMNDGKISTSGDSYSYGIRVDGDITVSGGEIVTNEKGYGYSSGIRYGNNYALYTCLGDVTITGGKITTNGYSGYMVHVGRTYSSVDQTVAISNVEFTNNLNEVEKTQGGHKAPVLVWEGSASNVTATITSGTFNGVSSTLLRGDNTTLTVSGGIFENAPDEKYLAEGFNLKENAEGAYEVLPKETKVAKIGDDEYFTLQDAIDAAESGETITLINNIELPASVTFNKEGTYTIDGKGFIISQANEYKDTQNALFMLGNTTYGDAEAATRNYTIKNVVFDGISGWGVIRSQGVTLTIDGCTIKNAENTQSSAMLRLDYTEASVVNSVFENNNCYMVITHNFNGDTSATNLSVDECVFTKNKTFSTALIYYVVGGSCNITNSEFVRNEVNSEQNGATIYLGFQENCAVTGCLFENNATIDPTTSTRVAGAIFTGYSSNISGNAFINNSARNANGNADLLGQDVCVSTYYTDVDLGKNYWGGSAPAEGTSYYVQHKDKGYELLLDYYYTAYTLDENGNVKLSGLTSTAPVKPEADVTVLEPVTLKAGDYMAWPSGDTNIDRPLEILMNFKANQTAEEAAAGGYGKWITDFYLTVDGLENGSITADNCYLAGNYGEYGWIVIPTDGLEIESGVSYPIVSQYDANLTYENICDYVKDFTAAIHIDPEILKANPNMEVKLELKMTNPDDSTDVMVIGEPAVYTAGDLLPEEAPALFERILAVYNMNTKTEGDITYYPVHVYAGIDTLAYKEVGFKFKIYNDENPEGIDIKKSTTTVYNQMNVTDSNGVTTEYPAANLGGTYIYGHELLFTTTKWFNEDTRILITPYALKLDGVTLIEGETKELTDAKIKSINANSALFKEVK